VSEEFHDLLRAEMGRVEASPRAGLVREAHERQRRRQQASRRAGLAATGCVAVVAAVATVVALQPGASRPSTSAASRSPAPAARVRVGLGGAGTAVQTTAAPVTATFTAEIDTTAASVLDEAARASGSQNVPLVNGWPAAPYWHVLKQQTSSDCPGQVITTNTWVGEDGTEVTGDKVTGPTSSDWSSSCNDPNTGYSPVVGATAGLNIGGQHYSWTEFAALPTDPAKLWPLLQADAKVGVASGKEDLFLTYYTIVTALTSGPVSPAMRVALFKVMEKFPSVHVTGKYTDSLGRTGTAITYNAPKVADGGPLVVGGASFTDVIDARTGQVLAQLDAAQAIPAGCVRATVGGEKGATCAVTGADVQVFISAGPASTTPLHLTRLKMPSVVGDSLPQAERELQQAGFRNGLSLKGATFNPRTRMPATGTVIAQSPAAGAIVTSITTPTLTLRP
jgi:hypothetical protein